MFDSTLRTPRGAPERGEPYLVGLPDVHEKLPIFQPPSRYCCDFLPLAAEPMARLPAMLNDWLAPERALPAALLLMSVVAVPILVLSPTGVERLHHLEAERDRADREVAQVTRQIEQLRGEVARVKSDPAALERIARDELGLVRQTELVFQFGR